MTPEQQAQYLREQAAECGMSVEEFAAAYNSLTPEQIKAAMLARALRAENASLRNQLGDNLCRFDMDAATREAKALPESEFLESCRRFRNQVAAERGEVGPECMTIAQLEAEVERLREEIRQWEESDAAAPVLAAAMARLLDPVLLTNPVDVPEIDCLSAEVEALRADKARLDWLEKIGFSTGHADDPARPGVHCWKYQASDISFMEWRWTAHYIGSEFKSAREAIDAAMAATERASLRREPQK